MIHQSNAQASKFYTLIVFLVVPSEPLPDDYDPSFFEKFVKMTPSVSFRFVFVIFIIKFTKFWNSFCISTKMLNITFRRTIYARYHGWCIW